jgi:gamma-glutamyl hercynylcysteine S-oxide hydrolase
MCRLLAHVGAPILLDELLYRHPFGLERQSYAPRLQQNGLLNADGWGVGWYDPEIRPEPARYRTLTPMWADRRFRDMAPLIRSTHVLAAVRSATPPLPVEESGAPPFAADRHLFAHNGVIDGFSKGLGVELRRSLSPARHQQMQGVTDSEVLFALALGHLDKGAPVETALAETVVEVTDITTGRLNMMLTDGTRLAATRHGDTLFFRESGDTTVIASEPYDLEPGWNEVPDEHIIVVEGNRTSIRPL